MDKRIPEKQLIAAICAISAAGKGIVSERIFKENIMPGEETSAARSIAMADFISRVAPTRYVNEWYTVALMKGALDSMIHGDENNLYMEMLLQSAGISRKFIMALKESETSASPFELSDLALALRFADIHLDDKGRLMDIRNDIRKITDKDTKGIEKQLLKLSYELSRRDKYDQYTEALAKMKEEGGRDGKKEKGVRGHAGEKTRTASSDDKKIDRNV